MKSLLLLPLTAVLLIDSSLSMKGTALRAALAATHSFSGETGIIKFDRHGNRREADPTGASSAER